MIEAMISKMLLGFTKNDKIWILRITVFVVIVSLFILFYGYNTTMDDWENSYNENMKKTNEERKVFKKLFEQGWEEHDIRLKSNSYDKNNRIYKNNQNSDHQWPTDIVIVDSSFIAEPNEGAKSTAGMKNRADKRHIFRKWAETMSNIKTDVNGKPKRNCFEN